MLAPERRCHREHLIPVNVDRTPFFCSGCPHNSSTVVPEGSLVGSGIGCHTMVLLLDEERAGDIVGITAMGNEGTQWIGMAPFLEREHFIHNIGDGTYFHSGQLSIQAAVSAGVSMTFKLLYNGALAMTGGQSAQGQREVADVVTQLLAVGVAQVLITTEDLDRYRGVELPKGVHVWDRSRLLEAQELLASVAGVTVLVHDQRCAAELRRDRKRGNDRCLRPRWPSITGSVKAAAIAARRATVSPSSPFQRRSAARRPSIRPAATSICPASRATVPLSWWSPNATPACWAEPGTASVEAKTLRAIRDGSKPAPTCRSMTRSSRIPSLSCPPMSSPLISPASVERAWSPFSQTLGTAAMLDGYEVRGVDQTGLSQKAGPVVSDVRLRKDGADRIQPRWPWPSRSAVGARPTRGRLASRPRCCIVDRTTVVGSTSTTPTGATISHPDVATPSVDDLASNIVSASRPGHQHWADATALTDGLFGHAVYANVFVVGMAVQAGCLPIRSRASSGRWCSTASTPTTTWPLSVGVVGSSLSQQRS